MAEARKHSREEIITYWREYLNKAGPGKALSHLLMANQSEQVELAESNEEFLGFSGLGLTLCVTLHVAAGRDARELLSQHHRKLEDAILECHTVTLAAAIGEGALRNYLRHLLIELFGWCGELDGMVDALTEMHNRRRKMPFEWTPEDLNSWWETFPPVLR